MHVFKNNKNTQLIAFQNYLKFNNMIYDLNLYNKHIQQYLQTLPCKLFWQILFKLIVL